MSKASRHGRAEVHEMHTQERPRTGNACFSNGICKFLMAISVPNLAFFGQIGVLRGTFFEDFTHMPLAKSCSPPRAGSKFVKKKKKYKKHVCRVLQARRKHQIAHESYKIEGVMHAVVYVDGALEKKCARDSSHKRFLKGAWSAQRAKRTSNGATRASKSHKNYYYRGRLGVKKVRFLMQEA